MTLDRCAYAWETNQWTRIPIIRRDADGTFTDGTARISDDRRTIDDFRDLDGNELSLPPGSAFEVRCEVRWEEP